MGDNAPWDRTKSLRDFVTHLRSIGSKQMASDTAVLVSSIILNNNIEFNSIPLIHDPEF